MLLYRYTKMMEEHSQQKRSLLAADGDMQELKQLKEQMEMEMFSMFEEDCSDWAVEATY